MYVHVYYINVHHQNLDYQIMIKNANEFMHICTGGHYLMPHLINSFMKLVVVCDVCVTNYEHNIKKIFSEDFEYFVLQNV